MPEKTCRNCGNAEWQRNKAGRRMFDQPGSCKVDVVFPRSYVDYRGEAPTKRYINKWTKPNCPCWVEENNS